MKEKGSVKKIAGLVLASALVIGSLGTAAALAAGAGDAVQKDTVMAAPAAPSPPEHEIAALGTIQYSKDVYARTDGSQNVTIEHWYDPATQEFRADLKEFDPDLQPTRYQSTYYIHGGDDLIIIQRDLNTGEPVSGSIMKRADQPGCFKDLDSYYGYDSEKEFLSSSRWTNIGTEQAPDGKTLSKLMSSYQSYIDDTTQANMQLIQFVDQETGLPVRSELYEDSTGEYSLFSSDIMEYAYVSDDGTIFKAPDMDLTPFTDTAETLGK